MSYVIGINGSPRKSKNSATMLEYALKGAASAGAETELVNLTDLNFSGCKSCFACKLLGGRVLAGAPCGTISRRCWTRF